MANFDRVLNYEILPERQRSRSDYSHLYKIYFLQKYFKFLDLNWNRWISQSTKFCHFTPIFHDFTVKLLLDQPSYDTAMSKYFVLQKMYDSIKLIYHAYCCSGERCGTWASCFLLTPQMQLERCLISLRTISRSASALHNQSCKFC